MRLIVICYYITCECFSHPRKKLSPSLLTLAKIKSILIINTEHVAKSLVSACVTFPPPYVRLAFIESGNEFLISPCYYIRKSAEVSASLLFLSFLLLLLGFLCGGGGWPKGWGCLWLVFLIFLFFYYFSIWKVANLLKNKLILHIIERLNANHQSAFYLQCFSLIWKKDINV